MYRFAEQVLRDPERRAAGMILEAKGDLCYKARGLLVEYGARRIPGGQRRLRVPLQPAS